MRRRRTLPGLASVLAMLAIAGCSRPPQPTAVEGVAAPAGVLSVYAVNYPLKYFAEQIGGGHVTVSFPAPADGDPAFWMPDSDTIAAYQQADLILLCGAGYANWVDKVSLPESRLCDTSAAFATEYIVIESAVTHSHGPAGEHAHGATAFTLWLDPELAIKQAEAIAAAFEKLRPDHQSDFRRNLETLRKQLLELDEKTAELVAGHRAQRVVFSHPVYQYFVRRYQLDARDVHWEPGEMPSASMWDEFQRSLQTHAARWMIWEAEPLDGSVAKLDELGVKSAVFDPCANVPAEGDYMSVMTRNIENLKAVFAAPRPKETQH